MRRVISISLIFVLILSVLSGCSKTLPEVLGEVVEGGVEVSESTMSSFNVELASRSTLDSGFDTLMPKVSVETVLQNQEERNGFILAPSMYSLSGVASESLFILRTPEGYGDKVPFISIEGQSDPKVTREDGSTFIIKPSLPLAPNSVYVFNVEGITWAFQTSVRFDIVSNFPRNEASNVPVRTGVEFEFSHGNEINIENYFSIHPKVDGEFVYRDSTTIFAPTNPLDWGQVYTVTLKKGVVLPGTDEVIGKDYTFSFETEVENKEVQKHQSTLYFSNHRLEFPTFLNPKIDFWLNYDRNSGRPEVKIDVYKLDQGQELDQVIKQTGVPRWSYYSADKELIDTSGLKNVYSSAVKQNKKDNWGSEEFTIEKNLTEGFYVVESTVEGVNSQMILQITDLVVQLVADELKALVWVNDIAGQSAVGAKVTDPKSGKVFEINESGVAVIESSLSVGEYLIVDAADGKQVIVFIDYNMFQTFENYMDIGYSGFWTDYTNNDYWTALQLDRMLFQRSDVVNFWGFVQNRRQQESIDHVRVEVRSHDWWGRDRQGRELLYTQNVAVVQGAYSGNIELPNLDPGSYEVTVFYGENLLNSTFFTVMDYVKPPYQLITSSDKKAIFIGDDVTFKAKTEFFEGTPVSGLELNYGFNGSNLELSDPESTVTDVNGEVSVTERPELVSESQGEVSFIFGVEATLPEVGWVFEQESVRVFINDIDVRTKATRQDSKGSLVVNVNDIVLDKLNNGTAEHWLDYLGAPVAGQKLSVEIIEIYWEKVKNGERYCNITRQVIPWYQHERKERVVDSFEVITNSEGIAIKDFTLPNKEYASYQARLVTIDGNGREIVGDAYIGRDYTQFFYDADDSRLFLDGVNPDGYDIGDKVELAVMQGTEQVQQGDFMFVVVSNEILSYHVGKNPLGFNFDAKHIPNTKVYAYHFNGYNYNSGWEMSKRLVFNTTQRELDISIKADSDSYKPGDMVTLTVSTKDLKGNPKAANVNIGLVDEALLALLDYEVDTLGMLYRGIDDNLKYSIATHLKLESGGVIGITNSFDGGKGMEMGGLMYESADMAGTGGAGDDTYIRERFEDTAIFTSVRTNAQGTGAVTFKLPDNITSWRATVSAISEDLYAGNSIQNIKVTQPMFLHYTLNNSFLVGDEPYLGVNVYGTGLTGGEQVNFEVWREDSPDDKKTATGVSFSRVNIPLWPMTQGKGALIIRASVAGKSDAVKHEYQVVNSYRLLDSAVFYDVTTETEFDIDSGGLTSITFSDKGSSQFLGALFTLRNSWWGSGARIEGYIARREATKLIKENFSDIDLYGEFALVEIKEYQQADGGISVLPYAESDLMTTVKLLPYIKDEVNTVAVADYLYEILRSSETANKVVALYGLALLGEPVLLELQRYVQLELSIRDASYIALGFIALGESFAAEAIYDRIKPHIQDVAPYKRINGTDPSRILDETSITALLAAQLNKPEALDLHNYVVNYSQDTTRLDRFEMGLERLNFIRSEINNYNGEVASITYTLFGESVTRELGGRQFTLKIPAQSMNEFKLTDVVGSVGAVSLVRVPLESIEEVVNDITIDRQYFKGNSGDSVTTFGQDDLVRVQIKVTYPTGALTGSYEITDFLPAGLVHVPDSTKLDGWEDSRAYVQTEGQRITFYDFNGDRQDVYNYYARVINPGTFIAEGTMVQSLNARKYIAVGESSILQINP